MRRNTLAIRSTRAAFTLTEILVVIVLIILMLGLAVPAFNLIKGSRSVDSAENQINALIGRARTDAIGLQKPFGVLFFIDQASSSSGSAYDGRIGVAEVQEVSAADRPSAGTRDVYLDRTDTDFLMLPAGVIGFTFNNNENILNTPYLGYITQLSAPGPNGSQQSQFPLGGLILFDGNGQIVTRSWGYLTARPDPNKSGSVIPTQIATDFGLPTGTANVPFADAGAAVANNSDAMRSTVGFVLCDRQKLDGSDTAKYGGGAPSGAQVSYIKDNSTPLLVNRYNGTLIRGE